VVAHQPCAHAFWHSPRRNPSDYGRFNPKTGLICPSTAEPRQSSGNPESASMRRPAAFSRAIDSALSTTSTPRTCGPERRREGLLACPASCVEDCASESPLPVRRSIAGCGCPMSQGAGPSRRRIPGLARPPLVTGWLPPAVRIGSDSCLLGHLRSFPATGVGEPDRRRQCHVAPASRTPAKEGSPVHLGVSWMSRVRGTAC